PGGDFAPGTIAVVTADGSTRQVADGVAFPNGMVMTPDDSTLIVAESYGNRLTAFDVAADGSLGGRRVWADVDGFPDGICLDAENAVWYADVPNKRCVRVHEGGEVRRTIDLDRGCCACARGGWAFQFDRGAEGDKFKLDELMESESMLLGRTTYEGFAAAWPSRTDGVGFAEKMNTMPKYVVSTTLQEATWDNSTIIRENV